MTNSPNCRRCKVSMRIGQALVATPRMGRPDFPGQIDTRGQTFTMTGPGVLIECWKCPKCGHSITKGNEPYSLTD